MHSAIFSAPMCPCEEARHLGTCNHLPLSTFHSLYQSERRASLFTFYFEAIDVCLTVKKVFVLANPRCTASCLPSSALVCSSRIIGGVSPGQQYTPRWEPWRHRLIHLSFGVCWWHFTIAPGVGKRKWVANTGLPTGVRVRNQRCECLILDLG